MSIYEELVERVKEVGKGLKVTKVVVGAYVTYAELSDGSAGLAYTERSWGSGCCPSIGLGKSVVGSEATEVAKLLVDGEGTEASLGLAVTNAVINSRIKDFVDYDALELLGISSNDVVGMVGLFENYLRRLLGKVKEVRVLEIRDVWVPYEGIKVLPTWKVREFCSGLSKLIITSATLSNRSLDYILSNCLCIKDKVLVGPSTPMEPKVFSRYGIKALCGSLITDKSKCFELICEGAGVKELMKFNLLRKVCVLIR